MGSVGIFVSVFIPWHYQSMRFNYILATIFVLCMAGCKSTSSSCPNQARKGKRQATTTTIRYQTRGLRPKERQWWCRIYCCLLLLLLYIIVCAEKRDLFFTGKLKTTTTITKVGMKKKNLSGDKKNTIPVSSPITSHHHPTQTKLPVWSHIYIPIRYT